MPTTRTTLIATKIGIPPLRSQVIPRPRLFRVIDDALTRPLTIMSAPAGFGKTTLLVSRIRTVPAAAHVGWLSLDSGDNEPVQFLHYLIAALHDTDARVGASALAMIGNLR